MEHVVFSTAAGGPPAFARFPSLGEAVAFVERLRNAESVTDAALFALTPVPMVVKTYYRVEVSPVVGNDAAEPPSSSVLETAPAAAVEPGLGESVAADTVEADTVGADTVGADTVGAGERSLGFFAH
jgi:hypothetical protein